jgi:hypothetical protein
MHSYPFYKMNASVLLVYKPSIMLVLLEYMVDINQEIHKTNFMDLRVRFTLWH